MKYTDFCSKKIKLSFGSKEGFRILCVSDIHGGVGYDKENTDKYFRSLLSKTSPDIVLLLGDIAGPGVIHIENAQQLKEMLDCLVKPLEEAEIPWAHVFGNHDDNYGLSNEEAQKVYESYPHCVSFHNKELSESSDYIIPVYGNNGVPAFCIYAFDSHRGNDAFLQKYGLEQNTVIKLKNNGGIDDGERGLDFCQVNMYYELSKALETEAGKKVPAMAVMHVPLKELAQCSVNKEETKFCGTFGEPVSCQCFNAGFIRACAERGDVKAVCFGHDHENNVSAEYCGITLCNDGYLSCHASHTKETLGGRIFDISQNSPQALKTEFINAL